MGDGAGSAAGAGARSWAREDVGLSRGQQVWEWQGVQVAGGIWMLEVIGGL